MRNKLYVPIKEYGFFIFIVEVYSFAVSILEFGKNANSIYVGTVNRTIRKVCFATVGVCVFRALTSVGALFYSWRVL